jgi:hypothetical protein
MAMGCRGIFGRRSMTPDLLIRTGLRQGRLWLGAGILACIAGVVALQFAATGLVHGNAILQDLGQHGVTAGKGWAVVGVALVASVLQWLRSRREALPSGPFLLAASVLAVLIYAGYARAFDLQWINDFADMWRLAVQGWPKASSTPSARFRGRRLPPEGPAYPAHPVAGGLPVGAPCQPVPLLNGACCCS